MPILSMNTPLEYYMIEAIRSLKQGKVYLLEASDDSSLIVKLEAGAAAHNVQYTLKTMKTVQTQPGKVLTNTEVMELKRWVDAEEGILRCLMRPAPQHLAEFKASLAMQGTWLKMPKADGLTDVAAVSIGTRTSKDGMRTVVDALRSPGGLEALGQIIAVDLFNGNGDRFSPKGFDPFEDQNRGVLTNAGNVMLSMQSGTLLPIGLDTYDPNNVFRNLDATLASIEASGMKWSGALLGNAAAMVTQRREFVEDIVEELEAAFGPRNRKNPFGVTRRLPKDAVTRILSGITTAIGKLQARFANAAAQAKAPRQIRDRIAALGW